ncbi:MAG TPA: aminoacetone oxidase family FAD-binding enzyme [Gemmatimonadales bacterium]
MTVAVIGAGAAGTMAAIFAARTGRETLLLEFTRDGGRKILISGGGRCNVLPARVDESRFVTASSPATLRNMLRSWPLGEQIAFFEGELGIPLAEETESAKLFPRSNRARDVRDGLLAEAERSGARFLPRCRVTGLAPDAGRWRIEREGAPPLVVDRAILATGGRSVPNTGSDGAGLAMLERLGHTLHPTYAALTPLTAEPAPFGILSGVSLRVGITARSAEETARAEGGFLFTHHGYSGPAVLDVSHVAVRSPAARVTVRWGGLGREGWEQVLRPEGARTVGGAIRAELPDRLAGMLLEEAGVTSATPLAQLRREDRQRLIDTLAEGELPWTGDEGYKKAEVTGGGLALSEVDPRSMESRRHPGLFVCGEALDAFGPIGGYNFLWAWATGRAAGRGAGSR